MKSIQLIIGLLLFGSLLLIAKVNAQTTAFEVKDGSTSLFLVDTNGDLTIKGKVKNGYGEMYIYENSSVTTISVVNTWYQIVNFVSGSMSGWSVSSSSLTASSGSSGVYFIVWAATFSGGANDHYEFVINLNDVMQTNLTSHRKLGSGGDTGSVSGCGILSISDGDVIKLNIKNETTGADATITHSNVTVFRL